MGQDLNTKPLLQYYENGSRKRGLTSGEKAAPVEELARWKLGVDTGDAWQRAYTC